HVTLTYVVSYLVLAALRSALVGTPVLAELAPITGPMYQLFIFFMVTDPRTTVHTKRGRVIVVAIVALVEAIIRVAGDYNIAALSPLYPAPPILALAIVGPVAMAIDLTRRQDVEGPGRRVVAEPPGGRPGLQV
ncbi:MAG TPA: RnfABCDGE type electron transport complex subunit D, partial [Gemmatimonadales bacterium]|nr:RnfABCDGE type electron transport complex subunit D [Gemmatimonadales bacterium]